MQEKSEFDAILMGAGVAIPMGTMFKNIDVRDTATYIVKQIKDKIGIVREDGKNFVMDGITSKNGALVLRKIPFKGRANANVLFNQKYNLVSNPYKKAENIVEGSKLSIISR